MRNRGDESPHLWCDAGDRAARSAAGSKTLRNERRAIGKELGHHSTAVRLQRHKMHVAPVFKRVDTCAAEFESFTPYLYSTYEQEDESEVTSKPKIVILGSGPNRIGQGIEFDYCCCHAAFALREDGFETVMVNCNPETVSTDYDTSDRLYFEPLTLEDVLAIFEREKPQGVVVQFGGQTPLNLALELKRCGVPIIGTPPECIDLAEVGGVSGDCSTNCKFHSREMERRWCRKKRREWQPKLDCRYWCGRATCWVAARW